MTQRWIMSQKSRTLISQYTPPTIPCRPGIFVNNHNHALIYVIVFKKQLLYMPRPPLSSSIFFIHFLRFNSRLRSLKSVIQRSGSPTPVFSHPFNSTNSSLSAGLVAQFTRDFETLEFGGLGFRYLIWRSNSFTS